MQLFPKRDFFVLVINSVCNSSQLLFTKILISQLCIYCVCRTCIFESSMFAGIAVLCVYVLWHVRGTILRHV